MAPSIPTSEEIQSGGYFLRALNNPACINAIRVLLIALAVGFIASYILILRRKKKERKP